MNNINNNQPNGKEVYTVEIQHNGEKTINEVLKELIFQKKKQLTKSKSCNKINL